jgi:hypothetical protein
MTSPVDLPRLREANLKISLALVHDNLFATPDELRRAVNDLGDEVRRLRKQLLAHRAVVDAQRKEIGFLKAVIDIDSRQENHA